MESITQIPDITLKIVVIGHENSGKTSLLTKYLSGKFYDIKYHTIGPINSKKLIDFQNITVKLDLWDIPGHSSNMHFANMFCNKTDAFILVYDKSSYKSFYSLNYYFNHIKKYCYHNPSFFIVANKFDLECDVSTEEGLESSLNFGGIYSEISVKYSPKIDEFFNIVICECIRSKIEELV